MTRHNGFTLIELLVVVAVIAALLGILMPGLSQAKQQAQGTVCQSNLRQLAVAAHVYAENHGGFYPLAYYQSFQGQTCTSYAWDFTSQKDWSRNTTTIRPGLLWQGDTAEKVQQCPGFRGTANWLSDPYTGYNYNTSYIGYRNFFTASGLIVRPVKTSEVKRPYRCALFGDGQYAGGANKFMRSPRVWEGDTFVSRTAGTQGFRHRGAANVAYCDGSAKSSHRSAEQMEFDRKMDAAEGTGFLSPDNSAYSLN